jgi:hypothetical protein
VLYTTEQIKKNTNEKKKCKYLTTSHMKLKDRDSSFREREIQYLVIKLNLPRRSLFKLWPTRIVPFDNSFFMDFYKMHQKILDKELIPKKY